MTTCNYFRYEKEEMEEFVLPLLMLSHVYVVPQLKRECERQLGRGLLTLENVVDVFQLALLCDAPRLSLLCHRMILKNFKAVSSSEAWQAMQQSHPVLEKELLGSVVDEDNVTPLSLFLFSYKKVSDSSKRWSFSKLTFQFFLSEAKEKSEENE